jgi:hypothetical protein
LPVDETIDGIYAGTGIDGHNVYVGHETKNGLIFPGGLGTRTSLMRGLSYSTNGTLFFNRTTDISYPKQASDCACSFVDLNAVPSGGYIVTFNTGTAKTAVGQFTDTTSMKYAFSVVGTVDTTMTMRYADVFSLVEKTTRNFNVLACQPGSPITTTVAATTTLGYVDAIYDSIAKLGTLYNETVRIERNITSLNTVTKAGLAWIIEGMHNISIEFTPLVDVLGIMNNLTFTIASDINLDVGSENLCIASLGFLNIVSTNMTTTLTYIDNLRIVIGQMQVALKSGQELLHVYGSTQISATVLPLDTIVNVVKEYVRLFRELLLASDRTVAMKNVFTELLNINCRDYIYLD